MSHQNINDDSRSIIEKHPFTQINNNIINHIKNSDAFLVWCYLYSKSENWKTIKQNIKNNYGFGDLKLKQIFSYLKRANLITYVQKTCANGKFAQVHIKVLSGTKFDKNQPYKINAPLGQKHAPPVHRTYGNDELLNKDITKQRKELNTKSLSASDHAQTKNSVDNFENFWKEYPVKKNKMRAKKIWEKNKYDKISPLIMADIKKRKENDHQWQNMQFIPHPSTYLTGELWNDDIVKPVSNPIKTNPVRVEQRSTVKEWVSGHPSYDALHGNKNSIKIDRNILETEIPF